MTRFKKKGNWEITKWLGKLESKIQEKGKNHKKGRNNKINNKCSAEKYSWNHTPYPIYWAAVDSTDRWMWERVPQLMASLGAGCCCCQCLHQNEFSTILLFFWNSWFQFWKPRRKDVISQAVRKTGKGKVTEGVLSCQL